MSKTLLFTLYDTDGGIRYQDLFLASSTKRSFMLVTSFMLQSNCYGKFLKIYQSSLYVHMMGDFTANSQCRSSFPFATIGVSFVSFTCFSMHCEFPLIVHDESGTMMF